MTLTLHAPAKINLSLRVRGRRANDGYHILESLVAFADIGDALHLAKGEARFTLAGVFGDAITGDNLVLQAMVALEAAVGRSLPSDIKLDKNLPIASGLGGGSADAAAVLRGGIHIHGLEISEADMAAIAASLGADVPVCLSSAPSWMTGIGHDVVRLADLPLVDIVLVNPHVPLPTRDVFAALGASENMLPEQAMPAGFSTLEDLCDFLRTQGNDLQAPATVLVPQIGDCLASLQKAGAVYAAMSGSGASCFGLCAPRTGDDVAASYRGIRRDDWVMAGRLIGAGDTKIDQA